MTSEPPIRLLLVEDSQDDADLLSEHLRRAGLRVALTRVDTLEGLLAALDREPWDLLLTDFQLPGTDGLQVLEEVGRRAPDLPCLVISGRIGEEAAVVALRMGAKDFIPKDRLTRLVPAIQRELKEARIRKGATQATAELRASEDRVRAMMAAALDAVVMIDEVGRISFWNPAAERMFGYSEDEALGVDLHQLVAPERYHPSCQAGFRDFSRTGSGAALGKVNELMGRRKDGSEFPAELSLSAVAAAGGWQAVGVVRDVTSRRLAEREHYEHIQFLQTLIETLPNPLFYEDAEGRVLGCNQALRDFLGRPTAEILGTRAHVLFPDLGQPDEAAEGPNLIEKTLTREGPQGQVQHAILRRARLLQAGGASAGHVTTLLDITHLKQTEEALRRNEFLFSAIHSHVVDLVAIIDDQGRRIYTSPSYEFVLGYSAQEMVGLSATELLHPEDRPRVTEALRRIMIGQTTQGLEYRLQHKDGRWLHFESTAALIPDPDKQVVRVLVVARNVTERKEAEQGRAAMEVQLRQSQKLEAIGQLAAGIAHEINTPTQYIGDNTTFLRDAFGELLTLTGQLQRGLEAVRALGGPAAALAEEALAEVARADLDYLGEEVPKAIQQGLEGVGRITKIVKAMKDFSHPGGESKTLTDLHHAIESTLTVSRNEWKYAAEVVTDFDPNLPLVPCYPGEFNQVILNLVVNAAHAIEEAKGGRHTGNLGRITVATRALPQEVQVSVADDGAGIPEPVRARMFEPFFTTKPVGKGSGQGLAIAHGVIVEKHKGRIEVRSEVGKGTTFTLHLPLEPAEPAEAGP